MPELRGAVSARLLAAHAVSYSPGEELLVTSGGMGAVHTAFDAFIDRGDVVALPDPVSPLYPLALKARGVRIRWVPTINEDGQLRLRLDRLSSVLRGAKMLVLCSPCNPTGGCYSPEDLEQIAWWAEKRDALILSDESFAPLCHDDGHTATATYARNRTLTVGSLSKGHGLAWARVGWLAGHRHLMKACAAAAALRDPFVPYPSQMAALAALSGEIPESNRQKIEARRAYVLDRLQAAGLNASWPAAGFFAWVRIPNGHKSGASFAQSLLQACKVRVVPGEMFGPSGARHVRISFADDEGRLEEGLNRLAGFVRKARIAPALSAA
jgi:aminotransferase